MDQVQTLRKINNDIDGELTDIRKECVTSRFDVRSLNNNIKRS